jgi:hypothetical protein
MTIIPHSPLDGGTRLYCDVPTSLEEGAHQRCPNTFQPDVEAWMARPPLDIWDEADKAGWKREDKSGVWIGDKDTVYGVRYHTDGRFMGHDHICPSCWDRWLVFNNAKSREKPKTFADKRARLKK